MYSSSVYRERNSCLAASKRKANLVKKPAHERRRASIGRERKRIRAACGDLSTIGRKRNDYRKIMQEDQKFISGIGSKKGRGLKSGEPSPLRDGKELMREPKRERSKRTPAGVGRKENARRYHGLDQEKKRADQGGRVMKWCRGAKTCGRGGRG